MLVQKNDSYAYRCLTLHKLIPNLTFRRVYVMKLMFDRSEVSPNTYFLLVSQFSLNRNKILNIWTISCKPMATIYFSEYILRTFFLFCVFSLYMSLFLHHVSLGTFLMNGKIPSYTFKYGSYLCRDVFENL